MKKIFGICIILFVLSTMAYSKNFFYFSPGITIGWNFGNGLTYTPKISIGMVNSEYEYYNVTYGYNFHTKKNDPAFNYKDYHIVELQAGSVMYFAGGGIGFAVFDDKHTLQVKPMISLFTGFGLYANIDIVFHDEINTNLGLQAVLPAVFTNGQRFGLGRY